MLTIADFFCLVGGAAAKIVETSSESDDELRELHKVKEEEEYELDDEDAGDEDELEDEREDDHDAAKLLDKEVSFS